LRRPCSRNSCRVRPRRLPRCGRRTIAQISPHAASTCGRAAMKRSRHT
jgi:hypothetical protein